MNWVSSLFSGGVSTVVDSVGGVLDNLFTSDEERHEAKRLMAQVQDKPLQDQRDVNKAEAAHRSVWVAGWRPAIGWVCAASLASYYIPQFVLGSIVWVKTCWSAGHLSAYPLEIDGITGLAASLLGLGTLRTVEKFGGKTK
jgi:hypothetical protein